MSDLKCTYCPEIISSFEVSNFKEVICKKCKEKLNIPREKKMNDFFEDSGILIYFSKIQHVEKLTRDKKPNGLWIITKSTNYNMEKDIWDNPCYISNESSERFLSEYHAYMKREKQRI